MAEREYTIVFKSKDLTQAGIDAVLKSMRDVGVEADGVTVKSQRLGPAMRDGFRDVVELVDKTKQAFRAVVDVAGEWIEASNNQEAAQVRLGQALRQQGTSAPALADSYAKLAEELEGTTGFADELLMEMEALLVQIGHVGPKDMKAALQAATDLSAGLGIDLTTATKAVAKAFDGGGSAIGKFLPSLKDLVKDGASTEEVLAAINDRFGGQAVAQMETYHGKLQRIANTTDNTKESFGDFVKSGIDPLLNGFLVLPDGAQKGAIGLGLVAQSAGTVSQAAITLGAAVAAASPLLGMTPATVGASAMTMLRGGVVAATGAFLPLGAAIAAVWAAWKIGNTETVKNSVAEWALSSDNLTAKLSRLVMGVDQLSPAAAHAAVASTAAAQAASANAAAVNEQANSHGRASQSVGDYRAQLEAVQSQVKGLTSAAREEITAGHELGQSNKDIADSFKKLHPELHLTEEGVKLYLDAQTKAAAETKKSDQALTQARDSVKNLATDLGQAAASGVPFNQMLTEFGPKAVTVSETARRMGVSVTASIAEMANTERFREWDELWTKLWLDAQRDASKSLADMTSKLEAFTKAKTDLLLKAVTAEADARVEANATERSLALQALEFNVGAAKRGHATVAEIRELEKVAAKAQLDDAILNADRELAAKERGLDRSNAAGQAAYAEMARAHKLSVTKMVNDWEEGEREKEAASQKAMRDIAIAQKTAMYDSVAGYFTSLGQLAGDKGIGSVLSATGSMVLGFKDAYSWSKLLGDDGITPLGGHAGSLSVAFNKNATDSQRFAAGVQAAGAITQGAINIWNAASSASTRLGASFNGAMAGLQAGAAFGPWGAAAGAAVGVVAGLFQNTLKKEVEAANKEIDKTKDKLLSQYGTLEQLDAVAGRVGLSFKENWGHQGKDGLEAFNKMAEQLESRLKAVDSANSLAISGFGAVVTGMTKPWIEFGKNLDAAYKKTVDAETAYKKAVAAADADYAKALTDPNVSESQLNDLHKKQLDSLQTLRQAVYDASNEEQVFYRERGAHAAEYKQQLADLGIQAVATFGASMVAGKTYAESIALIGPSVATLGESYKAMGVNVEDVGLKHLILQSTVAKGNPELIAATSGLGSSMQGLAQLGMLNVDTFGSMERTGMAMYQRLQGEVGVLGGDTRDALIPMQGYLQEAAVQAELLGIPLDANTQMLIDQSKELGIWKDKGKSAQDLLIDGMNTLVGSVRALIDQLLGVTNSINNIPSYHQTVFEAVYVDNGAPDGWGEGDGGGGEPKKAYGTFGQFPDWGNGTRVILHHNEAVVRERDKVDTARRWLNEEGAGGGSVAVAAPPNVYIVNDTSGARQVSEAEFQQIQARINSGRLTVPQRVVSGRSR